MTICELPDHSFSRDKLLLEMEERAKGLISIVGPEVGLLLFILAKGSRAKRILELGTAIGYSTIYLARGLERGGTLLTVERNPEMASEASQYLARAGVAYKVEVMVGSAEQVVPILYPHAPYDLVFIDVDKQGYFEVLPYCVRLLSDSGLLVSRRVRRHPAITTVVFPLGDGVAVSVKGGLQ